jgi:ketopantoate reductase
MRIAVIGAGGVGGAFGAALAKAGCDVTFVARGAHLKAMRERGLRMLGPRGDIHLQPTKATDDPASIGEVDVVLFCVKLWDVESAGAAIRPLVGKTTAVIPLQNGIDASERLIPILGKDAVMGGVAQISATIAEPGVIRQTGVFMRLMFGELDGRPSARGAAFHTACQAAGFDSVNTNEILVALWEKFVLMGTNSAVASVTRTAVRQAARRFRGVRPVRERLRRGGCGGPRPRGEARARSRGEDAQGDARVPGGNDALDGGRSVARQPAGTAVARRQGGVARARTGRADAHVQRDVRGAQALRQRRAEVGWVVTLARARGSP